MIFCRTLLVVLAFRLFFPASLSAQPGKEKVDLMVTSGTVVTMDGPRTIYDDGVVAVKGDTIVAVGPRSELEARYLASPLSWRNSFPRSSERGPIEAR